MRNIRKQLQLISSLAETVLQYRIEPYEGLSQHLKEVRKKIQQMIHNKTYEDGITQMLVSKESFQIKNKITKTINGQEQEKQREIYVQIRISSIEKCSCQIYNQQLWQFGITLRNDTQADTKKNQKSTTGIIQLIECILKHLQCTSLLPLNKQSKNRYMLDYKVSVSETQTAQTITSFQNMSNLSIALIRQNGGPTQRIGFKYFYNDRKIQQNIKQIILSKSLQASDNSKKNSIDSTQASRRVSLYEFYDDELDITVLSGSDLQEQHCQQILLNIQSIDNSEQFQILMEETVNDDQLFLRNNLDLFNELASLQKQFC